MKEVYEPCTTDENPRPTKSRSCKSKIVSFLPILDWLPNYQWKRDFHGDLIAGLTVGIMHVPQGMAYASLAGVPPVYGMYSSFFASTVYMFFGTARHISIGVFAVASMMVGAARIRLAPTIDELGGNSSEIYEPDLPLGQLVDPLVFTSALTLVVGIIQLIMGGCRLGFLTNYLSDPLVSGFTTGSAAHVFTSQLNKVFGVKLPRHEGIGMLIYMIRDVILSLGSTNFVALVISLSGIAFLDIGRTYLNPAVKKCSPVPPPLELCLVIIGVIISTFLGLNENYGVKIVSTIPRGMPMPSIPRLDIVSYLISDAVPIAVVCYMFVMSMGKLFAKKHKYKTDATQELYAVGTMSVVSSFFPVYPVGASLSRSSVCEMSGANTQLYTLFSSLLLLTVILFLGPFLEPLPMCILAAIVIVSLKSLFMQVKDLFRLWKISKYDFAIWLVSCLSTIVTDVTKGLIISIVFSLFTLVLRQQWPKFSDCSPEPTPRQSFPAGIKAVKFDGPIHFANVNYFIDRMAEIIGKIPDDEALLSSEVRTILVDCGSIAYVDTMGLDAIKDVYTDAQKAGIRVYYCGFNEDVLSIFRNDSQCREKVPETAFRTSIDRALLDINSNV